MASPGRQQWAKARAVQAVVRLRKHGLGLLSLPACDVCECALLQDLEPVWQFERSLSGLAERAAVSPRAAAARFWPAAAAAVTLAVLCVVPYSLVLARDPGSPLFISFLLHIAIVGTYLPRSLTLLRTRRIPLRYHAAMVALGGLFTSFKADAFARMPASLCMLLFNMQMVVGVAVQYVIFGRRYSGSQLAGVSLVTVGVAWANQAMQPANAALADGTETWSPGSYQRGALEVLAASVALALLNVTIRSAFEKFGESVEEQVFVQHSVSLLLVFPSQWQKVGPRFTDWVARQDLQLCASAAACVALNVAARAASVQMAGRSPNLLTTQLVQTLESFLQLLAAALISVPPWPPGGFWGGALVLALGTLQYLRASDAPHDEKGADAESA